jgi:hypothetical protein
MGAGHDPLRLICHLGLFVAALVLPVLGRAEVYHPCPELTFSSDLEVVEVGQIEAFNSNPDGGTPRTEGQANMAWAGNGAVGFESSRIGPTETYGDDKLNNGVYGISTPDVDDSTRPWIAADEDTSAFAGVKLGAACSIQAIGFGSRFPTRSDGVFTLQVTDSNFTGVDLEDPAQVAALSWTTVGTVTSTTTDEFGRHLVAFDKVAGVTAVRILVSQGGRAITEIEAYKDTTPPPEPDPPAAPTAYTNAILADGPIHYYRFEETHLLQPAKDAVGTPPDGDRPGAFQGPLVLGEPSAHSNLGSSVSFSGAPGVLVDLGAPFHPGPSVSVEAWVSLDPTVAVAYAPIAARWDEGGSYELDVNLSLGAGKANFVTKNDSNTFALAEGPDAFSTGVWHHVVGVFDQGKTTVYVDGVPGIPVDTSDTGSNLQDLGATLFIGATRDATQFTWKGLIDEVAFYDYALSPEQISGHVLAAQGCVEDPDLISISGLGSADVTESVDLTATLEGIDLGGAATFSWEVVAGSATVSPTDASVVSVSAAGPGAVIVRVSADDGFCGNLVTAEHGITFVDPRAAPTPYTAAVLADGPIHYYRFEEKIPEEEPARDAVGPSPDGDHPGTFQGNLTLGAPSAFDDLGQALSFDGTSGTLVNLGTPFHPGPTVSVEAWVNLDPAATALFSPIAARWDGSYELDYNSSTGRVSFVTRNAGEEHATAQSAEPLTKGVWHHIVGVFDQGITTLYVDGVQGDVIDRSATGLELRDEAPNLFIGSTRDGNLYNWQGLLDEVAFYDHALSPQRIAAHIAAASMPFHRGDANGDGNLDLSDGIFVFAYLFLGGSKPGCMESANANDGEKLDLSDGIYILNFLFLGGPPMPAPGAPGAPCGYDPPPPESRTNLGCKVYNYCE